MASLLRALKHTALRGAAAATASAISGAVIFAEGGQESSSGQRAAASSAAPVSSATTPAKAATTEVDKKLVKSMRFLVRDAMEGDRSLWRVLLRNEASDREERLLAEDAALLKSKLGNMMVFSGRANPQLADEIAYELGMPLGRIQCANFADGESSVHVVENVRGRDVYILQSTSQPVNESLLELVLIISAMRRASARTITAIIPYYGYKRDVGTVSALTHLLQQDASKQAASAGAGAAAGKAEAGNGKGTAAAVHSPSAAGTFSMIAEDLLGDGGAHRSPTPSSLAPVTLTSLSTLPGVGGEGEGEDALQAMSGSTTDQADVGRASHVPVSASDVARMLETAGVDRIISVELQPPGQGQIEGFLESRIPVESLRATSIGVEHIARLGLQRPVVVAPNEACIQLAHDFRSGLQSHTGSHVGFACIVEAGPSRGSDRYVHSVTDNRPPVERMELVGDVYGRDVVVVDDMLDTARTLMTRLQLLKDRGARRIVAYACHGLFNDGALQRITKSTLSDVIVTNTVPLRDDVDVRHTHKIAQLSVAPLLAEAALRTQVGLSLLHLRKGTAEPEPRYKGQE